MAVDRRSVPRLHRSRPFVALLVTGSLAAGGLLAACGDDGPSTPPVELSAAGERGKAVASDNGCTNCHTTDGSKSTGPTWKGLAGSQVELKGGETVTADEAYLRTAIVEARSETVDGYANIMPDYGSLSDDEVADLIAYLQDLGEG